MTSLPAPDGAAAPSRIRVLPSDLVNKIAAGEVVERPASVVKELLENAIDAGALSIDVDLQNGGKKRIEIADDGCGMTAAEAELAMRRHATSKIRAFEDLTAIRSLGFRGEALPSIASVSRFTLITASGESGEGTEILALPGQEIRIRPAARDRGTTVRVEDLFDNVPARQKFLKSADAEFRAIVAIVSAYALPSPERSFRLSHNGRIVLDLPPAASTRERALQVIGTRARDLRPIEFGLESCSASGWVSREAALGSRRNQFFFVNGRAVRDRVLTHAANRAVASFDDERFPAVVLFLDLPPEEVDVNVHPAKTEVRFRESGRIHVLVEEGIRRALGAPAEGTALLAGAEDAPGAAPPPVEASGFRSAQVSLVSDAPTPVPEPVWGVTPLFRERPVVQPPPARYESSTVGALAGRVIGQYRDSYILLDTPEGLRIVDQHVAHERVLYDRIDASFGEGATCQRLLEPALYETGAAEAALLESHLDELRGVGFEIERFSGNAFAVAAVPSILRRESLERFLGRLVDTATEEKGSHLRRMREKIVASLACQAAIKVHRALSGDEMSNLVRDLLASSNPFACPHGRPIIVDIRHLDIEKHFHRK